MVVVVVVSFFLVLFCFFFFAEKTMFSFQTLLKGTFRLLTCYLQFRPQNSPYFLRKPRTRNSRTNGLAQAGRGRRGGEVSATGKRSEKYV